MLSKLQAFLPEMAKQNSLLERDAQEGRLDNYNIELEEKDSTKELIEMVCIDRSTCECIYEYYVRFHDNRILLWVS